MKRTVLLATVALGLLWPAMSPAAPIRECPHSGLLRDGSVEHRGVSCQKARRLVRAFMAGSQFKGPHFKVDGFRCSNVGPRLGPGVVCKRGTKLARFLGTPDWLTTASSAPIEPPCQITGEDPIKDEICTEELSEWEAARTEDRHRERKEERELALQQRHEKEERRERSRRAPTVRRGIAEEQLLFALHENSNWRRRDYGYIDCRGGRINRVEWRCHLGWVNGAYCFVGRARVNGAWHNPNEGNRPWFQTTWRTRACPD